MVPEPLHREGVERLRKMGYKVDYETEPGLGHLVSMKERKKLADFLNNLA